MNTWLNTRGIKMLVLSIATAIILVGSSGCKDIEVEVNVKNGHYNLDGKCVEGGTECIIGRGTVTF